MFQKMLSRKHKGLQFRQDFALRCKVRGKA